METKHYKEELPAFVDQELNKDQRQTIAEHLMLCEECRREHDALKLGSSLAANLGQADAPDAVWANIADAIDGRTAPQMGLMPENSAFTFRTAFAFAASLIAVSVLSILVYVNLFTGDSTYTSHVANQNGASNLGQAPVPVNAGVTGDTIAANNTNVNAANTNQGTEQPSAEGWQVETIEGAPKIGEEVAGQIAVGELLETDAHSRARISVADIGTVDVSPNSRVKLVGTGENEHRLSLERGKLHAKIFAPPRLFVVDTPSGKAVDLGCEYTLDVDKDGNSILHVTSGFVALERGGRESIVPAGMMCKTNKGKGLGTPFSAEATEAFRNALEQFDFSGGGSNAVQVVLREADFYDMVTLWHLLSRVPKSDRGAVYDALTKFVKPPAGVTRDGIILLNKKMLNAWKVQVESTWFS